MTGRGFRFLYALTLAGLPLAGVGVARLATGRDWGAGFQPSWILLALALAAALKEVPPVRYLDRVRSRLRGEPELRIALVFALAGGVAVLASAAGIWIAPSGEPLPHTLLRFGKQVVQLLIMAGFVLVPALWTRGDRRWRWTARMVVWGAVGQALYGAIQWAAFGKGWAWYRSLDAVFTSNPAILSGSDALFVGNAMLAVPRLRGTMCEPLYLGSFLLMAMSLLPVTGWRKRVKGLVWACLVLLLALTWSRGAWLAAAAAGFLAVALLLLPPSRRSTLSVRARWGIALPLLAILVVLAAAVVADPEGNLLWRRLQQTFSSSDWSNLTRWHSMKAAWRAFMLSPVVGVGWGQFGWHFPLLADPIGLQSQFSWPVVNNFPLQVLSETGLLGFSTLACGSMWIAVAALRLLSVPGDPDCQMRIIAVSCGWVGVWLQLLTFSQYNLPHIWVGLGLMLAAVAEAGDAAREAGQDEG